MGRMLSAVLTLALAFTLLAIPVFADDSDTDMVTITTQNKVTEQGIEFVVSVYEKNDSGTINVIDIPSGGQIAKGKMFSVFVENPTKKYLEVIQYGADGREVGRTTVDTADPDGPGFDEFFFREGVNEDTTFVLDYKELKAQKMSVTASTKTVKKSAVAKKSVKVKCITVKNAKGKVTYSKVSSGSSKYLSVNKSGAVVVKKGTPVGTYKIKVKVTAAGNSEYKKATKTVTAKVKVKK
jgi:penicillin-binding protein-related factor A (putative recombinase)